MLPEKDRQAFARLIFLELWGQSQDYPLCVAGAAIAANESGWGADADMMKANNPFGIKPSQTYPSLPLKPYLRLFESIGQACQSFTYLVYESQHDGYVRARRYPIGSELWSAHWLKQYCEADEGYALKFREMFQQIEGWFPETGHFNLRGGRDDPDPYPTLKEQAENEARRRGPMGDIRSPGLFPDDFLEPLKKDKRTLDAIFGDSREEDTPAEPSPEALKVMRDCLDEIEEREGYVPWALGSPAKNPASAIGQANVGRWAKRRAEAREKENRTMASKTEGKKTYIAALIGIATALITAWVQIQAGDVSGAMAILKEAGGPLLASFGFAAAIGLRIAIKAGFGKLEKKVEDMMKENQESEV